MQRLFLLDSGKEFLLLKTWSCKPTQINNERIRKTKELCHGNVLWLCCVVPLNRRVFIRPITRPPRRFGICGSAHIKTRTSQIFAWDLCLQNLHASVSHRLMVDRRMSTRPVSWPWRSRNLQCVYSSHPFNFKIFHDSFVILVLTPFLLFLLSLLADSRGRHFLKLFLSIFLVFLCLKYQLSIRVGNRRSHVSKK